MERRNHLVNGVTVTSSAKDFISRYLEGLVEGSSNTKQERAQQVGITYPTYYRLLPGRAGRNSLLAGCLP